MSEQKIIDHIPKDLEDRFPEFVDKWMKVGLCTDRIDPIKAIVAVNKSYECAQISKPKYIFVCSSPYPGCAITHFMEEKNSPEPFAKYATALKLEDGEKGQKCFTVSKEEFEKFKKKELKNKNMDDILRKQMSCCIYGSLEGSWLSFYDVFSELIDEIKEKIEGLIDLANNCGFVWTYEDVAVICDRPTQINLEDGRLHCPDGPAIAYDDGFAVYAWKGIRVPRRLIEEKDTITGEEILKEDNIEMRRVKQEIIGDQRFLELVNAKPIQTDDFGSLFKIEMPGDEDIVMVKVVNSTPEPDGSYKDYYLRVPPHIETAHQGVAWSFGKEEKDEYAPSIET